MNKYKISKFLELAYKKNKIKNISQIGNDLAYVFYVENAKYKKVYNSILKESKSTYTIDKNKTMKVNRYKTGDIVFVKNYNYKNGEKGKNHLFLIVEQYSSNKNKSLENFGMLLSSKMEKAKYSSNIPMIKTSVNGLKYDSIIKTDAIYKIPNNQIVFKIGRIDIKKVEEYKKILINASA